MEGNDPGPADVGAHDAGSSDCDANEKTRIITVRMSARLHSRVFEAAHDAQASMNQWCLRALEDALRRQHAAPTQAAAAAEGSDP